MQADSTFGMCRSRDPSIRNLPIRDLSITTTLSQNTKCALKDAFRKSSTISQYHTEKHSNSPIISVVLVAFPIPVSVVFPIPVSVLFPIPVSVVFPIPVSVVFPIPVFVLLFTPVLKLVVPFITTIRHPKCKWLAHYNNMHTDVMQTHQCIHYMVLI